MIFFDVDNTLMDYKASQDCAAEGFARKYSTQLTANEHLFVEHWHQVTQMHMDRYLAGEISFQAQRRARIREVFPCALMDDEADQLFDDYLAIYQASWQLYPECHEALSMLEGFPKAVITNGDPAHQREKVSALGLSGYFEQIITPSDVGAPKPDRKIFDYAAKLSGKAPASCWYIGDDYEKDFLAAKDAGWNAIWLNRTSTATDGEETCRDLIGCATLIKRAIDQR